ncbi:hypothetical protein [Rossellomorea arthrocnemi]|jgi:hypothetical protein|uniref:hypothetical protein n=1 Tax=Rossellomorea arthrocnemi TaxID=2769542 RepID=UPI0019196986|nr:hypothetical protein [Rossellomorea arthrocnemi]
MSDIRDSHAYEELPLNPRNMQTTDELIHWILTVLSSNHLSEEELAKWWSEEIQLAIPDIEEK